MNEVATAGKEKAIARRSEMSSNQQAGRLGTFNVVLADILNI
jgi:hypothetical protein